MVSSSRAQSDSSIIIAMVCAGAVSAQFVAGKATRDALFLAYLDVTALPTMVIATSAFSILLVVASSRGLQSISPGHVRAGRVRAQRARCSWLDWLLTYRCRAAGRRGWSICTSPASARCSGPGSG